ncbi:hypothetical protein POM88_039620 [Heracleum sosnowskyi]|uniref:Uncharacterized protein n=1 Tax=Heracleum sosnowskyi TaxID=360622 RepID=A0AAD8HBI8_9APIA|nr:hypothetical protein POM88_039620 [Heracleum sosnowskyi]
MMKGNKPRKRRQSHIRPDKENMNINSSGTYNSTMSPQSTIFNTPQLNHEILSCKSTTTPTMSSVPGNTLNVQPNHLHDSLTRDPLSDITNIGIESRNKKKKNKGKGKVSTDFSDSARNLFENDFNKESHQSTDEYHDQLDNVQYDTCPPPKKNKRASIIPEEYASLGAPSAECIKCNACLWKEERVNKNVTRGTPIFSQCCKKGEVKLPDALPTPPYMLRLYNEKSTSASFKRNIRLYNTMFSFTSSGGNVDHSINTGRGPYIYRLNGQNHHVFGSLIPDDGDTPKFCQHYKKN